MTNMNVVNESVDANEMTDKLRAEFNQQLKDERLQKFNRVEELQGELSLLQENQTDPLDQATVVEESRKVMTEIKRLQSNLKDIKHALDHFDDFGYCQSCGVEIGVKRLRINASITLCVSCKTLEESKNKQYAQ
jgi:DnaK suppressor protein